MQKVQVAQSVSSIFSHEESFELDDPNAAESLGQLESQSDASSPHLSPALIKLLDVLVNLAQTGHVEPAGGKSLKSTQ